MEMICGVYYDKKLKQKLVVENNFVESFESDFDMGQIAMVIYYYVNEGEKPAYRRETTKAFLDYAEENLELLQKNESDRPTTIDISSDK